jgi:septal ring factor EnvC (AmiA/AmiB activator)
MGSRKVLRPSGGVSARRALTRPGVFLARAACASLVACCLAVSLAHGAEGDETNGEAMVKQPLTEQETLELRLAAIDDDIKNVENERNQLRKDTVDQQKNLYAIRDKVAAADPELKKLRERIEQMRRELSGLQSMYEDRVKNLPGVTDSFAEQKRLLSRRDELDQRWKELYQEKRAVWVKLSEVMKTQSPQPAKPEGN